MAFDAKSGRLLWKTKMADHTAAYAATTAPLAIKDKVITGIAGAEYGIRGFIDAYDAATGERAWRFYTIPGPGQPGNETWEGDSWKNGGGSIWVTGAYDPELDLTYWGVGNPGPGYNGDVRMGDNLYSDSVVALDPDDGSLKWHFQFTPHDVHDFDAAQVPVLADLEFRGEQRKLMLFPNRNAFFYVLDRASGEFLLAKQFAKQTWAREIDDSGRPVRLPDTAPSKSGTAVWPAASGGELDSLEDVPRGCHQRDT
jgi:alcohol dehydrogenase (cytochrome c)